MNGDTGQYSVSVSYRFHYGSGIGRFVRTTVVVVVVVVEGSWAAKTQRIHRVVQKAQKPYRFQLDGGQRWGWSAEATSEPYPSRPVRRIQLWDGPQSPLYR